MRGRVVRPQVVDQAIGGHHPAGVEREPYQQRPYPGAADLAARHPQGPQDPDPHPPSTTARRVHTNRHPTAPTPIDPASAGGHSPSRSRSSSTGRCGTVASWNTGSPTISSPSTTRSPSGAEYPLVCRGSMA